MSGSQEELRMTPSAMPGGRRVQSIESLNPYLPSWTIRARITRKSDLRSLPNREDDIKLFNLELIDEDGTSIEATLWRDVAVKLYDTFEEGKVYYISKGGLKPANKRYSSVKNDYELTITDRTVVEECKDASAEQVKNVQAKLDFTKIGDLPSKLGSKAALDVLAVVYQVSPIGSVKRKADNSELVKRNLMLVDTSGKSVEMTLWGNLATEEGDKLEKLQSDFPIVAFGGVRSSDYNGVSLSSGQRTRMMIDPDVPEKSALREWFVEQGSKTEYPHCAEGLTTNKQAGQGRGNDVAVPLKELLARPMPEVGNPEYANVWGYVSNVPDDQALYYMAAPDGTNKKVVDEGGRYYCEATQKHFDTFLRRYIMRAQVIDHSGSCTMNFFNDGGETVLGATGDELAALRETKDGKFEAALKARQFLPYTFRIKCTQEEYQGKVKMRYTVMRVNPVNFADQAKNLVVRIKEMLAATQA